MAKTLLRIFFCRSKDSVLVGSTPLAPPMSLPPSSPVPIRRTGLFIARTEDAFLVLQAALDGKHHLCTKSLSDAEREQLEYHGSVVVWDERAVANDPENKCKGKQRWKYSTTWTPSRMQGVFLVSGVFCLCFSTST